MHIITEPLRADSAVMDECLDALQERIGPQKFNAWFRHGTRLALEGERVKVLVPNQFVANWIENHYLSDIAAVVEARTQRRLAAVVAIDPQLSGDLRKSQLDSQAQQVARAAEGRVRPRAAAGPALRHRLEDFVVGESNRLAYSSALAVAGAEASPFSQLFIHGPCGVGKTHLLQGICSYASRVRRQSRPVVWRYVTSEQFTNEFVAALKKRQLEEFRARYRRLDLLAIDDVHFLAAKKATQEEFLHTFNAIQTAGKQVIMASDAHPKLVGDMNEQLVSRFLAGMVVKVSAPDKATRMEILRRRSAAMKLAVPQEALEYIALHVHGSVRELEGALLKLAALSALEKDGLTLTMVTSALADHLARTDSAVTLGDIEAAVAALFGITPADIHSSRRTRTVSLARMLSMFLARRHTRMSYPEIGRFMGKNHSSVVLAVQRMEALLADGGELEWLTPAGTRSMPAQKVVEMLTEQLV